MKRKNPKSTKFDLRTLVVTKKQNKKSTKENGGVFGGENSNPLFKEHKWLLQVPKDIRQQASFELSKNWKTTKGKLDFKSKNAIKSSWVFNIEKDHVSILPSGKIRLYSKSMRLVVRTMKKLPDWLLPNDEEDTSSPPCQIMIQKSGLNYYVLFPFNKEKEKPMGDEGHMVGLDPGCRKFMSFYGTDGRVGFIGSKNPGKKFARMEWFKDLLRNYLYSKRGEDRYFELQATKEKQSRRNSGKFKRD